MDIDQIDRQVRELMAFKAKVEPMLAEWEKYQGERDARDAKMAEEQATYEREAAAAAAAEEVKRLADEAEAKRQAEEAAAAAEAARQAAIAESPPQPAPNPA